MYKKACIQTETTDKIYNIYCMYCIVYKNFLQTHKILIIHGEFMKRSKYRSEFNRVSKIKLETLFLVRFSLLIHFQ